MKYIVITSLLVLTGCYTETTGDEVNGFDTTCMNGVLYYFNSAGYGKSIAPAIDSETLTYVTCEGDAK
jgi:hypothetical protein